MSKRSKQTSSGAADLPDHLNQELSLPSSSASARVKSIVDNKDRTSSNSPSSAAAEGEDAAIRAIVVGVSLPSDDLAATEDDLQELTGLLETLGVEVAGRVLQKRQKLTAKCLIGPGKVEEVRELAEALGCKLVVFDHQLTPPQIRNIEKMTCCEILDRTGVILEIFARHAQTSLAKTQVEIARLEYLLPRMTGAWTHFQRQTGGGVRSRGMGEKQIEIDRRRARDRIGRLHKQLEVIEKDMAVQRKSRRDELKVALVGYTNSGKTTLMRALTKATTDGEDALFATLDSSIRTIDPNTRPKILLSDTVGFIRNLPHGLVESFKTTLNEVLEADLLLHVIDISHSNYVKQITTTEEVLEDIGAGNIAVIKVFNKWDQTEDPHLKKVLTASHPGSICLSAHDHQDALRLRNHVFAYFESRMARAYVAVPPNEAQALSLVYKTCMVMDSTFTNEGHGIFLVQGSPSTMAKLKRFAITQAEGQSLLGATNNDEQSSSI